MATYAVNESVVVFRTYPELALELVKMMSFAKSEIYLASRYYEPSIGNKVLAKFAEGVPVHLLDANVSGTSFEERIRAAMAHDSKNRNIMSEFLNSNQTITRATNLPYSFGVIDGKYCGIELTDPINPDNFFCALKLESSDLAEKLINMFESLASSALVGKPNSSKMTVHLDEYER